MTTVQYVYFIFFVDDIMFLRNRQKQRMNQMTLCLVEFTRRRHMSAGLKSAFLDCLVFECWHICFAVNICHKDWLHGLY